MKTSSRGAARTWVCAGVLSVLLLGCASNPPTTILTEQELTPFGSVVLREGDVVDITFPTSPTLNTTQTVRRDGKIALPLVGELVAVGKTPSELEKDVLRLYEPQLVTREVFVNLQTSGFPVFITGAVLRAGKLTSDRPLTALEAIMESGGFALDRANMKAVVVIRKEDGGLKHYVLDLKKVLQGKSQEMFYLRPSDIIYVPEKRF